MLRKRWICDIGSAMKSCRLTWGTGNSTCQESKIGWLAYSGKIKALGGQKCCL